MVKNPPEKAGDIKDAGLIPGSGRSPGGGCRNSLNILALRISWTEEPGRLWFIEPQRVKHDTHVRGFMRNHFSFKHDSYEVVRVSMRRC